MGKMKSSGFMLQSLYLKVKRCTKCKTPINNISTKPTFLFLPPFIENQDISYIFLTMEPTDDWCQGIGVNPSIYGVDLIKNGFKNFSFSNKGLKSDRNPFLLQYTIHCYLTGAANDYLITDFGKCAMPTGKSTTSTRKKRFVLCYPWLRDEIKIINPKKIFLLNKNVQTLFNQYFPNNKSTSQYLAHYSNRKGSFDKRKDHALKTPSYQKFLSKKKQIEDCIKQYGQWRLNHLYNAATQGHVLYQLNNIKAGTHSFNHMVGAITCNMLQSLSDSDLQFIFYYAWHFSAGKMVNKCCNI